MWLVVLLSLIWYVPCYVYVNKYFDMSVFVYFNIVYCMCVFSPLQVQCSEDYDSASARMQS